MSEQETDVNKALWRYGIISPLLHRSDGEPALSRMIAGLAKKTFIRPDGSASVLSAETLRKWLYRYRRGGLDALHDQTRADKGLQNIPQDLPHALTDKPKEHPNLTLAVPVGLTSHREGLPPLRPVTRGEARDTVAMLGACRKEAGDGEDGEPFAVAADEYYLLAMERIPGRDAYGSFPQTENGVGLLRRFLDEESRLFRKRSWPGGGAGGTVVTGRSASRIISKYLGEFSHRANSRFELVPVRNRLMGESVTVTGLLGGNDILSAVGGKVRGVLYVPAVTLRDAGGLFLDGLSPAELSRQTGAEVRVFEPTPRGFFQAVYGGKSSI